MIQTKSKVDDKIEALEQQLLTVKGRETEKYARIVGYYRAVKNWNKGKAEEYKFRVSFSEKSFERSINGSVESKTETQKTESFKNIAQAVGEVDSYMFFYRTTCPNCPPVKAVIKNLILAGESINADSAKGFTKAAIHEIFTAPTVVLLDNNKKEITRTSNVTDLKILLKELNIN
ncbi:MAG: anaerobic ribonucleoside-triphosphate reductase [Spirochaetaceae bacterium]